MERRRSSKDASGTPRTMYRGLDGYGKAICSETPVVSGLDMFVRGVVKRIREEKLSPADVISLLRGQPEEVTRQWSQEVIRSWMVLDKFWQWPLAFATNTTTRTCMMSVSQNGTLWLSDENAWTWACDEAERIHGYGSRLIDPEDLDRLASLIGS